MEAIRYEAATVRGTRYEVQVHTYGPTDTFIIPTTFLIYQLFATTLLYSILDNLVMSLPLCREP